MAQRATSLGPNLFSFVFLFVIFFSLEQPLFPTKKGHFFIFQCLPLFLLSFFPSPFSLSRSLSLSFCFFALFLCFCFMKKTTCLGGSCLVLSFKSLFLSLFFPYFKLVFWSTLVFLCFKKDNLSNTNFGSSWGLQHTLFLITCVLKNVPGFLGGEGDREVSVRTFAWKFQVSCIIRTEKTHHSQRRDRILHFFAVNRGNFLHIWSYLLTYTEDPGEIKKNPLEIRWRKLKKKHWRCFPESAVRCLWSWSNLSWF